MTYAGCSMKCRGEKDVRLRARYDEDYVYCAHCTVSFRYPGIFCPCCSRRVRRRIRPAKKTKHTKARVRGVLARGGSSPMVKECPKCGASFIPDDRRVKYCTLTCKTRAKNAEDRKYYAERIMVGRSYLGQ